MDCQSRRLRFRCGLDLRLASSHHKSLEGPPLAVKFQLTRDTRTLDPLYEPAGGVRPLRLVFDEGALPAESEEIMRLLRALSSLDEVIRWSYDDAGPPDSVR